MAVLIGMSADVKGQTHEISDVGLTIGRSAENNISINNPTVSGKHCAIKPEGDHYVLRDFGSTNGTRVNSKEITEAVLKPKDLVQVGSVEFLFNSEDIPLSEAEAIYNKTEIVEAAGPAVKPQSFNSISPFGARRRENQGLWVTLITVIGLLTLAAVGYLLYELFTRT
ncbi:MAG TPA: FHA domain-containing protein [Kiritimatiellia bacterium]|nr:FHA domain-containing protein [Kiritimatiellia bacterium]HMO99234.1 FHA domain-containing protein [Kiritimatiellia bacterium]HMP97887.1 FHA domain-containing protein [Kiritimatiellia bacterium]